MYALEITKLVKDYRDPSGATTRIIDVTDFKLNGGDQVVMCGDSGTGKTTLLHLIAGIIEPSSGIIAIHGDRMSGRPESQRDLLRAKRIGYVFQSFHLLPGLSAIENIEIPLQLAGFRDRQYARHLLDRVGLIAREHYRPAQLSVGQQQRVALARALANRPALVLADEPTGNLDRRRADEAAALLCDLCRENQAALLVVTHDAAIVSRFERRVSLSDINHAAPPLDANNAIGAAS